MKIRLIYRPTKKDKKIKKQIKSKGRTFRIPRHFRLDRHFMYHVKRRYWLVKKRPWLFRTLMVFPTILILGLLGLFGFAYFYTSDLKDDKDMPIDFGRFGRSDYNRASYVLDANNQIIGRFFYEVRDPIKYKEIPQLLKNGFVAAEDKRFYSPIQFGMDPLATLRAGIIDAGYKVGFKYGNRSGASGITQQASRLLYADDLEEFRERKASLSRKFKEARFAIQLIKKYSKEKIFENLLNMIYFGHGVNGVSEACRYYFGKDIRKDALTPQEVAILVSLNKSPTKYCPIYHKPLLPEINNEMSISEKKKMLDNYETKLAKENTRILIARERYNWVLKRMYEEHYITEREYNSAKINGNELLELSMLHITPLKNHDFGYADRFVKEMLLSTGHDDEELSYSGGLKIYTTIDSRIQKIADEEFQKHLLDVNLEKDKDDKSDQIDGAYIIMEVKTFWQ